MPPVTFDTLEAKRLLCDAGLDDRQARAIVRLLSDSGLGLVARGHSDMGPGSDAQEPGRLLKAEMQEMEKRLIFKFGAMLVVAMIFIIAALKP